MTDDPTEPNFSALSEDTTLDFEIRRHSRCGTPEFWEEEISFVRGHRQGYFTLRSAADEGGAGVGRWWSADDSALGIELLGVLQTIKPWALSNELVEPGQELITWHYTLDRFTGSFSCPSDSPALRQLSELDMLLRRIPYWLTNNTTGASQGAALFCNLRANDSNGFSVGLENRGTKPAAISNPCLNVDDWNGTNYVRVEIARPVPTPDTTGLGLVYEPLPFLPEPSLNTPLWQQATIVLQPGSEVVLPFKASLDVGAQPTGSYLRAVFSDYRPVAMDQLENSTEALPIRGRVYSLEKEL